MKKHSTKRSLRVAGALTIARAMLAVQNTMRTLNDGLIPPLLGYARLQQVNDRLYGYRGSMYLTEATTKAGLYAWERQALEEHLRAGRL